MNKKNEMNMYEYIIVGDTPALMHKYNVGTVSGGNTEETDHKTKSPTGKVDYSMEWIRGAYTSMKQSELDIMARDIVVPSQNLQACLRDAGKQIKLSGRTTAKTAMASGVIFDDMEYPILIKGDTVTCRTIQEKDWLHVAGAVVQGRRVDRVRAYVPPPWKVVFRVRLLHPDISPDIVAMVIEHAGIVQGLFDWRPGARNPGQFGRFHLESYKAVGA